MIEFSSRDTIFKSFDHSPITFNREYQMILSEETTAKVQCYDDKFIFINDLSVDDNCYEIPKTICNIVIYARLRFKNRFIAPSYFVFYKDIGTTKKSC